MVPQAILNCNKSDFFDIILFHKISSQGALLFLITGINPSNLLTFVVDDTLLQNVHYYILK